MAIPYTSDDAPLTKSQLQMTQPTTVMGWVNYWQQDPTQYPVESPLPKDRLPPEPPIVLEDAEIRWGKASNFNFGQRQGPNIKYSVRTGGDDDDDEDEEQEIPELVFTEIPEKRKTQTRKITANNGDPDIWVEFALIDEIVFDGKLEVPVGRDGQPYTGPVHLKYVLKHPPDTSGGSSIPIAPLGSV